MRIELEVALRNPCLLSLLLALASNVSSDPRAGSSCPLQPTTYRSPSGRWSVHVDPTRPFGEGEARYTLELAGEPLWTLTKPWTLRLAHVTERGTFAGHALLAGSNGWREEDVVLAIVDAGGRTLLDERLARPSSTGPCSGPPEIVPGTFVQQHANRFVFRRRDASGRFPPSETWVVHDLGTGERLRSFHALEDLWPDHGHDRVLDAFSIEGTPLLALRLGSGVGEQLGCLRLVDESWNTVWMLPQPDWATLCGPEDGLRPPRSCNVLPASGPRRVRYGLPGPNLIVELVLVEDPSAPRVWSVHSRVGPPPPRVEPEEESGAALPSIALELVAETHLHAREIAGGGDPSSARAVLLASEVTTGAIGHDGRVYVVDARGTVFVHGPDGARLHSCVPPDGSALEPWAEPRPAPDGTLYVRARSARDDPALTHLAFDESGTVLGGTRQRHSPLRFVPGGDSRWTGRPNELVHETPSGVERGRIVRSPSGSFLRRIDSWDVGPGGSLALLDRACCQAHPGPALLCLYAADGAPLREVVIPATEGYTRIATGARWTVVDAAGPSPILVRNAGGELRLVSIEAAGRALAAACPRDGSELWILCVSGELSLRRYRLPD